MTDKPLYILDSLDDRDRLLLHFERIKPSFLGNLGRTLALAGVGVADPAMARFRLLDVACGEGLYADEIARRFPSAEIVAFDRDPEAIAIAQSVFAAPGLRFLHHDAHQPLPGDVPRPFDVIQIRLGVTHFTDAPRVFENLFAAARPGAGIYLLDARRDTLTWSHPSMDAIQQAAVALWSRFGTRAAGERHVELLEQAGFRVDESLVEEHAADLVTDDGRTMLKVMIETARSMRKALVEIGHVMSGEVFDEHIKKLRTEVTPEDRGLCRFQVTYATRP